MSPVNGRKIGCRASDDLGVDISDVGQGGSGKRKGAPNSQPVDIERLPDHPLPALVFGPGFAPEFASFFALVPPAVSARRSP
jgi:hypothetical protein